MKSKDLKTERDLKIFLASLESEWNKVSTMKNKKIQARTLAKLRFEIKDLLDSYERTQDRNYYRLYGKVKRWVYTMEGRLR